MASTPLTVDTNPNLWGGEYAQGITTAMVLGGDDIAAGLWRVEEGIDDKVVIKRMSLTSALQQDNFCSKPTPTNNMSMADFAISNKDYLVYEQYCKDDFAKTNYALRQPNGILNKEIPTEVLQSYIEERAAIEANMMAQIRWSGDMTLTGDPISYDDGIIVKIKANNPYDSGTNPTGYHWVTGSTASTDASTVLAEIERTLAAVPHAVRRQRNFKIVVSPAVAAAYESAVSQSVGVLNFAANMTQANQTKDMTFLGFYGVSRIPMYIAIGLDGYNDEVILMGNLSNDRMGNLVLVTDATADFRQIIVQDRQKVFLNEPFVDISWACRMGVDVQKANEIALYHI